MGGSVLDVAIATVPTCHALNQDAFAKKTMNKKKNAISEVWMAIDWHGNLSLIYGRDWLYGYMTIDDAIDWLYIV